MLWVRSAVCLHTQCEMVILFVFLSHNIGGLCMCTLFALFHHDVGAFRQMQSPYVHAICSKLVLSDNPCSICVRTSFVPSLCCQINQSLCVHIICSKLVLSDKPVSVCAYYLLCPLTTLLLSDKPVPLSTLFAMSAHNVSSVR